ncbi:MAG: insulinase family protein, partial [Massilia sp.]
RQGFGVAEFERAKKSLLRAVELAYGERDKTDSKRYVDDYIGHFLNRIPVPGIDNDYLYARSMLPEITLDELNAYARKTIPSGAPKLLVYVGPVNPELPPVTPGLLHNAVREAEQAPVRAHDERKVAASLMAKPPAAGGIVAERANPKLGTTTLTLSNGIEVILKPTDFSNGRVTLSARRYGGKSQLTPRDALTARFAAPIVQAMGLGGMAPLELQQVMAGSSAALTAVIEPYGEGLNGSAASADLETLLQLAHLRLTTVRRDEALFKSFVGNLSETARVAWRQPEAALEAAYQSALYGDNPWALRPPTDSELAGLELERAIGVFQARLGSARGMSFVLVGSFDPQAVKPLLAAYLASLPTPDLPLGYRSLGLDPVRGVVKTELQAGAIDKSFVRLHFGGPLTGKGDDNLRLQAVVDVMNLRMKATLREQLGLIYSARLSGAVSAVPESHYDISTTIPTSAANSDKVVPPLLAEIRRLQEQGPSAEELAKVKQNWLQVRRAALREDSFWAGQLLGAALRKAEPVAILDYEKKVEALSADDVKLAAQRYFDMGNVAQVTLTPKSKLATFLGM